ncbi:tetratricopeptide repeat protein [bacterium]|nr:tetratricopeptide repeat protein [bacterium]
MFPRHLLQLGLALLLLNLHGCAVPKRFQQRVERLERGIEDVRVVQAELIARVDGVENQARKFSGKVQELEYSQSYQIGGDVDTLKQDISRLQRRIPPPPLVPQVALENDEIASEKFPPELERIFQNSLRRVRTGSYREAIPGFMRITDSGAADDIRARAYFWLGISEEGAGNNPNALRAYHLLSQNFPSHSRVPLALLRQASVFIRLKDTETGRLTLQKIISQFPSSPEAADARSRLKKLR